MAGNQLVDEVIQECAQNYSEDTQAFNLDGTLVTKASHPYWLDNMPVSKQLRDFGILIRKDMPWVSFGIGTSLECRTERSLEGKKQFAEAIVYVKGQRFALGRIGHRDYGIREVMVGYGVYSRKVRNKKIQTYNERYHTAFSTDITRAVKNAVKNLMPYTLREIAGDSYETFRDKVRDNVKEFISEADKFLSACKTQSVLTAEITNLIRQNVEFVTPEFKAAAQHYLNAANEAQVVQQQKVSSYYVSLITRGDVHYAQVLDCKFDAKTFAGIPSGDGVQQMEFPIDELPHDIQPKLAVMMSMSDDTYTPGIGYKQDAKSYWVERIAG